MPLRARQALRLARSGLFAATSLDVWGWKAPCNDATPVIGPSVTRGPEGCRGVMELRKYIGQRLIQVVIIFFVILTVLFVLFRLAPGDPISRMVDPDMTPEDAQRLKVQLGLDQPVWAQYFIYLT